MTPNKNTPLIWQGQTRKDQWDAESIPDRAPISFRWAELGLDTTWVELLEQVASGEYQSISPPIYLTCNKQEDKTDYIVLHSIDSRQKKSILACGTYFDVYREWGAWVGGEEAPPSVIQHLFDRCHARSLKAKKTETPQYKEEETVMTNKLDTAKTTAIIAISDSRKDAQAGAAFGAVDSLAAEVLPKYLPFYLVKWSEEAGLRAVGIWLISIFIESAPLGESTVARQLQKIAVLTRQGAAVACGIQLGGFLYRFGRPLLSMLTDRLSMAGVKIESDDQEKA